MPADTTGENNQTQAKLSCLSCRQASHAPLIFSLREESPLPKSSSVPRHSRGKVTRNIPETTHKAHRQIARTLSASSQNLSSCGPPEIREEQRKCLPRSGVRQGNSCGSPMLCFPSIELKKEAQFCTPVLTTKVLRPISKGSSMTAPEKSLRVCKAWRQQFE